MLECTVFIKKSKTLPQLNETSARGWEIPYVQADINQFRSSFSTIQCKFCGFVAENATIFSIIWTSQGGYYIKNEVTWLFEDALGSCFDKLDGHQGYITFVKERNKQR